MCCRFDVNVAEARTTIVQVFVVSGKGWVFTVGDEGC